MKDNFCLKYYFESYNQCRMKDTETPWIFKASIHTTKIHIPISVYLHTE
jgi:hypothetical protein